NAAIELLQLLQVQIGQVATQLFTFTHSQSHGFVGITERQAFLDQVISQISSGRKALQRSSTHGFRLDLDTGDQVYKNGQGVANGISRIEQTFLVFLIVLVVGQRLAFHQSQQGNQVTIDATGLATGQLGNVRVFL